MLGRGDKKLYKEGAQTEGLVVHRADSGDRINYHITIRVKFADGETTEFKKWLDWHYVGQIYEGSAVPIRYDPSDHSKVVLDMPVLEERHAQADAAGKAQLEAQLDNLVEPGAGLESLGGLKAQLLQTTLESVVNLPSNSSGTPEADRLDSLAKLADLKERGVLSEEEFAAEKARILDQD